jgi:hypothetical protein
MVTIKAVAVGAALAMSAGLLGPAHAHGGGLNAEGCHHDRKHGGYHCHRASAVRSPTANYAPSPEDSSRFVRDRNGSTYFANCSAARAAGAAPVRRGEPGYGRHLDRDGDGVGCE